MRVDRKLLWITAISTGLTSCAPGALTPTIIPTERGGRHAETTPNPTNPLSGSTPTLIFSTETLIEDLFRNIDIENGEKIIGAQENEEITFSSLKISHTAEIFLGKTFRYARGIYANENGQEEAILIENADCVLQELEKENLEGEEKWPGIREVGQRVNLKTRILIPRTATTPRGVLTALEVKIGDEQEFVECKLDRVFDAATQFAKEAARQAWDFIEERIGK